MEASYFFPYSQPNSPLLLLVFSSSYWWNSPKSVILQSNNEKKKILETENLSAPIPRLPHLSFIIKCSTDHQAASICKYTGQEKTIKVIHTHEETKIFLYFFWNIQFSEIGRSSRYLSSLLHEKPHQRHQFCVSIPPVKSIRRRWILNTTMQLNWIWQFLKMILGEGGFNNGCERKKRKEVIQ